MTVTSFWPPPSRQCTDHQSVNQATNQCPCLFTRFNTTNQSPCLFTHSSPSFTLAPRHPSPPHPHPTQPLLLIPSHTHLLIPRAPIIPKVHTPDFSGPHRPQHTQQTWLPLTSTTLPDVATPHNLPYKKKSQKLGQSYPPPRYS